MTDPFRLLGPSVISFSGGRTSAYMLHRVLQAHNGKLPSDAYVIFANTGLEHPGTYRFVNEVAINWNVPIVWLEYAGKKTHRVVAYETASRNGEPFDQLINERTFLPNSVMRFCTQELKVLTIDRFMTRDMRLDSWQELIGLRADEPHRVAKLNSKRQENRDLYAPLYHAKVDLHEVQNFWKSSSFDLNIPPNSGNCVGCFLKGTSKLTEAMREYPDGFGWWIKQEDKVFKNKRREFSGRFCNDRPSYKELMSATDAQPMLFGDDTLPCSCTD